MMEDRAHILGHQLKGIMFHCDLMERYALLGSRRFCLLHKRQVRSETAAHIETRLLFAEICGELTDACVTTRVDIPEVEISPSLTREGKETAHKVLLDTWRAWEEFTLEYLQQAVEAETNEKIARFLSRLCAESRREICEINRLIRWS